MSNKLNGYFAKALLATFLVLTSVVLIPRVGWGYATSRGDLSDTVRSNPTPTLSRSAVEKTHNQSQSQNKNEVPQTQRRNWEWTEFGRGNHKT